jgi:hypothetical protein
MAVSQNKTPEELPEEPTDLSPSAAQTRLLVRAVQDSLVDVKTDIREIKSGEHAHFLLLLKIFGAAFVLLSGMLIFGYFRLEDRVSALDSSSIRIDTKLEDLLLRIPPIPTPPKR